MKVKIYKKYWICAIILMSFQNHMYAQLDSIHYESGELKAFGELKK